MSRPYIESDTIFPLKMTFAQKTLLLDIAWTDGINADIPGALNAWVLKKLGVDI